MKKLFCLFICLLLLVSPALAVGSPFPVADKLDDEVFEHDGVILRYRIHVPENYSASEKYPVLLYLHGAGEIGSDNLMQIQSGVQNLFDTRPELLDNCIFILPQCPEGLQWVGTELDQLFHGNYSTSELAETPAMTAAIELLKQIMGQYSCDRDRVYIMGLSMGGFGTWDALVRHGELFTAAVPMCGGGDEAYARELADFPIWTYHGTADPTVMFEGTQRMYDLIVAAGGDKIRFTAVEGAGHNVWDLATSDAALIDWLFSQSKTLPPEPTAAPEPPPTPEPGVEEDGGGIDTVTLVAGITVLTTALALIILKITDKKR